MFSVCQNLLICLWRSSWRCGEALNVSIGNLSGPVALLFGSENNATLSSRSVGSSVIDVSNDCDGIDSVMVGHLPISDS